MSKIIKCQVNDEYVLGSGVVIGAAGSYGDVILQLQFNEMWDGLAIMATFKDALNQHPVVIMLVPSMLVDGEVRTYEVYIPVEAKRIAGRVRLTLTGYSIYTIEDNGEVTPFKDSLTNTSTAFFRVLESDAALADDGSIGVSPTPTLAEQALAAINEANRLFKEADDRIDDLDGKVEKFAEDENQRQTAEFGEGYSYNEEKGCVVDENKNPVDNSKAGRVGAELERQIAEFGAVGNKWNEDRTAIIDKDGIPVENIYAGRVGAELERQAGYTEMKSLIGDIDSAVDAILAIQLKLIGGAS
jgi:hypothetical protein